MKILKIFSNKTDWDDITLEKFNKLKELGPEPNICDVIDIVYGINSKEIPYTELKKYPVSFLNKECPRRPIKKRYTINGNKYDACFDITKINTAQFVDFRNYSYNGGGMENVLSVCMIPKGHKYNDGYDIDKVKEDMLQLPITDAQTIAFFFINQLVVLLQSIQSSLLLELKETEDTKKMAELLDSQDLINLISYLYY